MPRPPLPRRITRLPRRITLPFGWIIRVEYLPEHHETLYDETTREFLDGIWDQEGKTIYINKHVSVRRRRRLILHELDHALNDLRHWAADFGLTTGE